MVKDDIEDVTEGVLNIKICSWTWLVIDFKSNIYL